MPVRKPLEMSPPIGFGNVIQNLPGSERMVGGPLKCMYHELSPRVIIGSWECRSVYMNIPFRRLDRPYGGAECQAVYDAIEVLRRSPDDAKRILIDGEHVRGHRLPGVFTWENEAHRVDMRRYENGSKSYMWAALYIQ